MRFTPPTRGRDLRIDLLRGWCVVTMIAGHIGGASYLHILTGADLFYTSAAEGFITISGLVMGLVYRQRMSREPGAVTFARVLRRTGLLYLLTVSITLITLLATAGLGLHWMQTNAVGDPLASAIPVLTLHRTYYFVDIPLLYTLLVLVSPLALLALSRGRPLLVLGASWLLWGAYQFIPQWANLPWPVEGNTIFTPSTWQIFFFHALVLGWYQREVTEQLSRVPRTAWLAASGLGTAAILGLFAVDYLLPHWRGELLLSPEFSTYLHTAMFGKLHMGLGRIVVSVVVFTFIYLVVTELWVPISRALNWVLIPLGQHALYAYIVHILIALPLTYLYDRLPPSGFWERPVNTVLQVGAICLIWMLIRHHVLTAMPSLTPLHTAWNASGPGRWTERISAHASRMIATLPLVLASLPGGTHLGASPIEKVAGRGADLDVPA
jgi:hypothetical protein